MDRCEIIRVKPWSDDQGAFVEISAHDFDPDIHHVISDPLDHDGDGAKGGSVKGFHSTAAKGARNKKAGEKGK